jgi:hypothetical protein
MRGRVVLPNAQYSETRRRSASAYPMPTKNPQRAVVNDGCAGRASRLAPQVERAADHAQREGVVDGQGARERAAATPAWQPALPPRPPAQRIADDVRAGEDDHGGVRVALGAIRQAAAALELDDEPHAARAVAQGHVGAASVVEVRVERGVGVAPIERPPALLAAGVARAQQLRRGTAPVTPGSNGS